MPFIFHGQKTNGKKRDPVLCDNVCDIGGWNSQISNLHLRDSCLFLLLGKPLEALFATTGRGGGFHSMCFLLAELKEACFTIYPEDSSLQLKNFLLFRSSAFCPGQLLPRFSSFCALERATGH